MAPSITTSALRMTFGPEDSNENVSENANGISAHGEACKSPTHFKDISAHWYTFVGIDVEHVKRFPAVYEAL